MIKFYTFAIIIMYATIASSQSVPVSMHDADQVVQGPCYTFATVAALESKIMQSKIANNIDPGDPNLNEWLYYSKCVTGNSTAGAVSGDIFVKKILKFTETHGSYDYDHFNPVTQNCPNPQSETSICYSNFPTFVPDDTYSNENWCETLAGYDIDPPLGTQDSTVPSCTDTQGNTYYTIPDNNYTKYRLNRENNQIRDVFVNKNKPSHNDIKSILADGNGVIALFDKWVQPGQNNDSINHALFIFDTKISVLNKVLYSYKNSWPGDSNIVYDSPLPIGNCTNIYYINGNMSSE